MPQKSIDSQLRAFIRDRAVNSDETAESVHSAIEEFAKGEGLGVPSLRTVSRYLGEYRKTRATSPYRIFRWPEHIGDEDDGLLPWASARACLDLLSYANEHKRNRPTVAFARLFWNATQSAPDADVATRIHIVIALILGRGKELEQYLADRCYLPNEEGTAAKAEPPAFRVKGDPLPGRDLSILGVLFKSADGVGFFSSGREEGTHTKKNRSVSIWELLEVEATGHPKQRGGKKNG